MASVWVYTCTGTRGENTIAFSSAVYGTCEPASAGQWQEVQVAEPFNPADHQEELLDAFGAGFIVLGFPLIGVLGVRFVLKLIKSG
jgi:hypothetical protein